MSKKKLPKLIVILGPTATGKTKLAVALARKFNGEIVSVDSRQVYKGMDIGTGKDLSEYSAPVMSFPRRRESRKMTPGSLPRRQAGRVSTRDDKFFVPYHLIDAVKPNTEFNVAKFKKLALEKIYDIRKRGKTPFLVGGTGLYISAIVDNLDLPAVAPNKKIRKKLNSLTLSKKIQLLKKLDPAALKFIDIKNPRRVDRALEVCLSGQKFSELRKKKEPLFDCLELGVTFPKKIIDERIDRRVDKRIKQGMIQEIAKLHKNGVSWRRLEDFGLEYRFIAQFLQGQTKKDEMIRLLKIAIHQFAKRQMTWFKRDKKIKWIKNEKEAEKIIKKFMI
jgi:tRNA dimethylallyltransferase